MPSFASGLVDALAKGVTGYAQGEEIARRQLVTELARKRAEERQARLDEEKRLVDRATMRSKGYTPASTAITLEPPGPAAPAPATFDSTLARAADATGLGTTPSPFDAPPVKEGSLGMIPKVRVVETPESFDPLAGTQGMMEAMREGARADALQRTLDSREAEGAANRASQEKRAAAGNQSRELIAKLREANTARRLSGTGGRQITANAREANARQAAKALLNIHGSKEAALAWLASPDGAAAREQGVQPFHFDVAAGLQQEGDTRAAIGMSHTMKPERAVERVRGVRAAAASPGSGVPSRAAPASLPPLTKAEKDRAAADPLYKQFKESKGYKF
jgi:hypothetical protein